MKGSMHQRKHVQHGLIQWPRVAGWAVGKIKEIRLRHHDAPECDVMAGGTFQTGGIPGVLDLPLLRWHPHLWQSSLARRSRHRFAVFSHDADAEYPVSMLTATGERPATRGPPAARHFRRRPSGRGRGRKDDIGSVAVELLVG